MDYDLLCTSFLTRDGTTSCSLSNAVSTSHMDSMSAMISTPVKILLAFEGATSMLTYGSLLGSSSTAKPNFVRSLVDVALMPVVSTSSLPFGEVDPLFSPDPEVSNRTTWSLVKEGGRCPRRKAETSVRGNESRFICHHMVGQSYYACLLLHCNFAPFVAKVIRRSPKTTVNCLVVIITGLTESTRNDVSVALKYAVNYSRSVISPSTTLLGKLSGDAESLQQRSIRMKLLLRKGVASTSAWSRRTRTHWQSKLADNVPWSVEGLKDEEVSDRGRERVGGQLCCTDVLSSELWRSPAHLWSLHFFKDLGGLFVIDQDSCSDRSRIVLRSEI